MNPMNKKAVSPLIATVLLVSITLTAIFILSSWSVNFATKQTGLIGDKSDTQIQCSSAGLAIDNVSYNCTSGKLMMEAYNSGTKDLSDFRIQVLLKNGSSYTVNTEPNATVYSSDTQVFYNSTINVTFSQIDRVILKSNVCPSTARSGLEAAKITGYGC